MKTARTTPPAPTPGPWTGQWNRYSGSWCVYNQNNAYLAEVGDNSEGDPDQAEANARLIAAAPTMLELLETLREWSDMPDVWIDQKAKVQDALDGMIAIAKAEGRST